MGWKKYIFAFVITSIIFATAIAASNYFNNKRIAEIESIESRIAVDILSLETQFDLLQQLSCADVFQNPVLSSELETLGERLDFAENSLGVDNPEVMKLKRSYTLLEIKDYLLMKKVTEKCPLNPTFIFYFYSNEGDCPSCVREGYVLTALKQKYPDLRVYSFDYNLDLSALKTLIAINKVEDKLPALIINNKAYYGFNDVENIEKILPELEKNALTEKNVE